MKGLNLLTQQILPSGHAGMLRADRRWVIGVSMVALRKQGDAIDMGSGKLLAKLVGGESRPHTGNMLRRVEI